MSGTTPTFGSLNKDKVANTFGIQLKPKDSNKQSQPTTEKKLVNTGTSSVTKNKSVSDFPLQNQSNGFQNKTNLFNHSNLSKTPEPERKSLENSTKSRSSVTLVSMPTFNERRNSFISNVNHSISLNPVKSDQSSSKSPEMIKRSSLTPVSNDQRRSSLTSKDRSISPEPSSIKQISITKTPERSVSPAPTLKQTNLTTTTPKQTSASPILKRQSIPTTTTTLKTEAEIEHQKDQPLYKRQLSKTLDTATSMANKTKHQHELLSTSTR